MTFCLSVANILTSCMDGWSPTYTRYHCNEHFIYCTFLYFFIFLSLSKSIPVSYMASYSWQAAKGIMDAQCSLGYIIVTILYCSALWDFMSVLDVLQYISYHTLLHPCTHSFIFSKHFILVFIVMDQNPGNSRCKGGIHPGWDCSSRHTGKL